MRQALVVGNWKMNGTRAGAKALATAIIAGAADHPAQIAVCVPYVFLADLQPLVEGSRLALGAQNVADQPSGAYTGEVCAAMLAEFACKYALVGHSERRTHYGDSNASVAARFAQAIDKGVVPILCIGETLAQREDGQTFAVLDQQLDAVVEAVGIAAFGQAVIAYEPVWAIGTGKTATDDQAQEAHHYIRQYLAARDAQIAAQLQILYGGSVKPENAKGLFAMPDIDGGLIGGASLAAESFLSIYHSA